MAQSGQSTEIPRTGSFTAPLRYGTSPVGGRTRSGVGGAALASSCLLKYSHWEWVYTSRLAPGSVGRPASSSATMRLVSPQWIAQILLKQASSSTLCTPPTPSQHDEPAEAAPVAAAPAEPAITEDEMKSACVAVALCCANIGMKKLFYRPDEEEGKASPLNVVALGVNEKEFTGLMAGWHRSRGSIMASCRLHPSSARSLLTSRSPPGVAKMVLAVVELAGCRRRFAACSVWTRRTWPRTRPTMARTRTTCSRGGGLNDIVDPPRRAAEVYVEARSEVPLWSDLPAPNGLIRDRGVFTCFISAAMHLAGMIPKFWDVLAASVPPENVAELLGEGGVNWMEEAYWVMEAIFFSSQNNRRSRWRRFYRLCKREGMIETEGQSDSDILQSDAGEFLAEHILPAVKKVYVTFFVHPDCESLEEDIWPSNIVGVKLNYEEKSGLNRRHWVFTISVPHSDSLSNSLAVWCADTPIDQTVSSRGSSLSYLFS
eukprot:Hpha_TRINITY_DN16771_c1_g9::TRINITY_DN16771_c1_g9_i2::g.76014::m.76014